jgi:L-asparaginase
MGTLPQVAVVLTGGTITMLGRDRVDLSAYRETSRRLSDTELLERVPEAERVARVLPTPFGTMESTALTTADWVRLARCIENVLDDGADGVVIAHGTNTLEETAYFLHLTLDTTRPVVLTGSMRPASSLSADGDLNLFRAIATAADPAAADKGVLVVLDEAIVSARDVVKAETTRPHAFQGRGVGPLGFADGDGVRFSHLPTRPHTGATEFGIPATAADIPPVHIVVSYAGADATAIDAYVAAGAAGIVVAATGSGAVSPIEDSAIDRAIATGTAICITSRIPTGNVPLTPDLAARGLVTGGELSPWKARVLLSLGCAATRDPRALQRLFDTY